MIRTVIEVSGDGQWEFERELKTALDKLGYEPKRDPEYIRFMHDLHEALNDRGLSAQQLVEERRAKLLEEQTKVA